MARRRLFSFLAACVLFTPLARAREYKVIVTDNPFQVFEPQYLTIQEGDTVTWENVSGTHNVLAADGTFVSGSPAAAPWTYSHTFASAGSFLYSCSAHAGNGQNGQINVRTARPPNEIAYTVGSWDMQRKEVIEGLESSLDFVRTSGLFQTGVRLPTGAQITALEIAACDDFAIGGGTGAYLYVCPEVLPCALGASVATPGAVAPPACGLTTVTLADGPIVNNANNTYVLEVFTGTEGFRSVKIYYKKILSPAPLTATFSDVPTNDIAFRAIEALAASGITQGCATGQFCGGQNVTRAQMAIFLARAFGLFWPN